MRQHTILELARLPAHQRANRLAELFADDQEEMAPPRPTQIRSERVARPQPKPLPALARKVSSLTDWLRPRGFSARLTLLSKEN